MSRILTTGFTAHYDGDGLRDYIITGGTTTYYLYDGSSPVIEETFNGSTMTTTIQVANGFADGWRERDSVTNFVYNAYAFDPQGSLSAQDNSANTLYPAQNEYVYDGYGRLLIAQRISNGVLSQSDQDPVQFGGQYGYYTDASTGEVNLTHRYYDPSTGHFLNRDPIGYRGGQNLYAFCDNNPITNSDPDGDDDQRLHFPMFPSRKTAMEAAKQASAKGQKPIEHVFDYTHPEAPPHFHAVDARGAKKGGTHYGYPRPGGQLPSEKRTAIANKKLATSIVGAEEAQKVLDKAGPAASKLRIRKLAYEAAESMKGDMKEVPVLDLLFVLEDFFVNNKDHSLNGFTNSVINGTSPLDQVYIMKPADDPGGA